MTEHADVLTHALLLSPRTPTAVLRKIAATLDPSCAQYPLLAANPRVSDAELATPAHGYDATATSRISGLHRALTRADATPATRARVAAGTSTDTLITYLERVDDPDPVAMTELAGREPGDALLTTFLALNSRTPARVRARAIRDIFIDPDAHRSFLVARTGRSSGTTLASLAARSPEHLKDLLALAPTPHVAQRLGEHLAHHRAGRDPYRELVARTVADTTARTTGRDGVEYVHRWADAITTTGSADVATAALAGATDVDARALAITITNAATHAGTPVGAHAQVILDCVEDDQDALPKAVRDLIARTRTYAEALALAAPHIVDQAWVHLEASTDTYSGPDLPRAGWALATATGTPSPNLDHHHAAAYALHPALTPQDRVTAARAYLATAPDDTSARPSTFLAALEATLATLATTGSINDAPLRHLQTLAASTFWWDEHIPVLLAEHLDAHDVDTPTLHIAAALGPDFTGSLTELLHTSQALAA